MLLWLIYSWIQIKDYKKISNSFQIYFFNAHFKNFSFSGTNLQKQKMCLELRKTEYKKPCWKFHLMLKTMWAKSSFCLVFSFMFYSNNDFFACTILWLAFIFKNFVFISLRLSENCTNTSNKTVNQVLKLFEKLSTCVGWNLKVNQSQFTHNNSEKNFYSGKLFCRSYRLNPQNYPFFFSFSHLWLLLPSKKLRHFSARLKIVVELFLEKFLSLAKTFSSLCFFMT